MGFMDFFTKPRSSRNYSRWREFGTYQSIFNAFGSDIYASELVRSCIRPLAEFSSKAEARCSDESIEKLLNTRPNLYMNGKDFLYKIRTKLEVQNTAFILIMRDDKGKAIGFYPVPWSSYEALEYQNGLFIKFRFNNATEEYVFPWEDLAVLRKDYKDSDIAGENNSPILNTLELVNTTNQGIANAVKSTANLRGILKSTKAMLSPEDVKKSKEAFVSDYLSLSNEGGIASLDATQEFHPINMTPVVADYNQTKEFREDVYRYYGVNDNIVMSNMNSEQLEVFYEARIEPFLVALAKELTSKVFTARQLGFNNVITYEANKLQFASLEKKIQMFKEVVLYGGMTINEWREGCNMPPIDGGDERIMRLDAGKVGSNENE